MQDANLNPAQTQIVICLIRIWDKWPHMHFNTLVHHLQQMYAEDNSDLGLIMELKVGEAPFETKIKHIEDLKIFDGPFSEWLQDFCKKKMAFKETNMTIKFEVAKGFEDKGINLPKRGTSGSAGYDFEVAEDVTILPLAEKKKGTLVKTGVKVKLPKNTYLALHPRSSLFNKKGLILANGVGVIDSDYYGNDDNDGHVMVNVLNLMDRPVDLKKGEKIAQGIISHYFITNEDSLLEGGERSGGFGSTDK